MLIWLLAIALGAVALRALKGKLSWRSTLNDADAADPTGYARTVLELVDKGLDTEAMSVLLAWKAHPCDLKTVMLQDRMEEELRCSLQAG